MKSNEQLIIEYAQNRRELRDAEAHGNNAWPEVHEALRNLVHDYFDGSDDECSHYQWTGWVDFLRDYCDPDDCTSHMFRLADAKDHAKDINRRAGQIKRDICTRGRKLIKDHA